MSRLRPAFWDHQRHVLAPLARAIEQAVADFSLARENAVVVDFGSGDAPYQEIFQRPGLRYLRGDLEGEVDLPIVPGEPLPLESASADAVVSFQVLEHVRDLDWYLGEARRLLAPGGRLLLSTHGVWLYHPHPHDFRRWTREGLEAELADRGWRIERIQGLVGPLAWPTQMRLLGLCHLTRMLPLVGKPLLAALAIVANAIMALEDAATPASIIQDNACVYVVVASVDREAR